MTTARRVLIGMACVGLALGSPAAEAAKFITGFELLLDCEREVGAAYVGPMPCLNYIAGVIDGYHMRGNDEAGPGRPAFCLPDGVTLGQLQLVVTKWLREHPGDLHSFAGIAVHFAVSQAFPCRPATR